MLEKFLFFVTLQLTKKGTDVFNLVKDLFLKRHIMLGVCESSRTDGAPGTMAKISGFVTHVRKEIPRIMMTGCMLHLHGSTTKTLPTMLKDVLSITNSVVIFIRVHALNHCFFCAVCEESGAALNILIFLIEW
jgi:hypothetical protein